MRFFFFIYCFPHFEDIHLIIIIIIIIIIITLFHKNRNKKIPVCSIQQQLELEKQVKLVEHVVSFIGKELAEDSRSCHQVPVASIAE